MIQLMINYYIFNLKKKKIYEWRHLWRGERNSKADILQCCQRGTAALAVKERQRSESFLNIFNSLIILKPLEKSEFIP